MNYDGILSQLTEEQLNIFQSASSGEAAGVSVQEGAIEEEQAATIQTIQVPRAGASASSMNVDVGKTETSTPQRKISTSSRFINAFQQFYTGATSATTSVTTMDQEENNVSMNASAANRTPTKGMESKLLSMWHNVKYGWSGKLKSNFSKEQPVWLLGRCYHRKYTPPTSMESSTEANTIISASTTAFSVLDNKLLNSNGYDATETQFLPNASTLYPQVDPHQIDEIMVPQELGTDAAENQIAENPWEEGIEGFRRDFYSRIWMTYRREFPTMNGSSYTSDCGWGCMLRSGQMLLAQALICHFLGRSWRYDPETQLHSTYEDSMHKKIIKWFGDSSSKCSPFSIHALVSIGEALGKKPGDWYGPSSVSYLLKLALKNAAQENADFDNITIYVAKDCTIYMQDVKDECCIPDPTPKPHVPWQAVRKVETAKSELQNWKSLIVLIPLRLGSEKLNPVYAHCLKLLLSTEYCIGIIGGRPKHSLYFVGFQEDKLIHMDPHYCQEMVDVNQENFSLQSFHCKSPRKLKSSKMDPSCCVGFYCETKTDFDKFVESVQLYLHPMRCASGTIDKIIAPSQQMPNATNNDGNATLQFSEINYPLFSFSRGRCLDHAKDEMSDSFYKPVQRHLESSQETGGFLGTRTISHACDDDDDETEEFVLL